MWLYGSVEAFSGIAGVPYNLETTSTSNIHVLKLLATLAPWQLSDIIKKSPQKAVLQVQAEYSRFIYLSFLVSIDLPNESHTDCSQPELTAVHLVCLLEQVEGIGINSGITSYCKPV